MRSRSFIIIIGGGVGVRKRNRITNEIWLIFLGTPLFVGLDDDDDDDAAVAAAFPCIYYECIYTMCILYTNVYMTTLYTIYYLYMRCAQFNGCCYAATIYYVVHKTPYYRYIKHNQKLHEYVCFMYVYLNTHTWLNVNVTSYADNDIKKRLTTITTHAHSDTTLIFCN